MAWAIPMLVARTDGRLVRCEAVSQDKERRAVIKYARSLGWTVDEKNPSGKGYFKMLCRCGKHKKWLHKTPSNPNYWAETKRYVKRVCEKNLHVDEFS